MKLNKLKLAITAVLVIIICSMFLFDLSSLFGGKNTVTRSVYFWKNSFAPSENEVRLLDSLGINKMYFKLADIDWNAQYHAHPVVKPSVKNVAGLKDKTLVPVLFITNRTMQQIPKDDIKPLAMKLWTLVSGNVLPHYPMDEVQLDCDWSETSRDNFFSLVQAMKEVSKLPVSVTIRLYQYKHRQKAGVPPADRGMLMFYNMGNFKAVDTDNSIFDADIAKQYLDTKESYPLPLDIALPTFGWSILYRNNSFMALVDELDSKTIATLSYIKPVSGNIYRVTADTVLERGANFEDIYLRNGDMIKLEEMDATTLPEAAQLSKSTVNGKQFSVAFFDFDTETIQALTPAVYEKTYNSFK